MASRKKPATESIHDRDRIIVRLPDGMRDDLAALAEANGRSMTSEVVAALEKHLKGVDRLTQLWEFFERHREQIEEIPFVRAAVENLETFTSRADDFHGVLQKVGLRKNQEAAEAAMAAFTERMYLDEPLITAEQVQQIRALLSQTGKSESVLLTELGFASIEDIRGSVTFKRALSILEKDRREKKGRPE
jgi:predicted DNA-binding protein